MFDAMHIFLNVVEHKSFTLAAKKLKMSTAKVSRKVAELEAFLETQLLQRNTRSLALTGSGLLCYQQCKDIPHRLLGIKEEFQQKKHGLSGTIHFNVATYSAFGELLPLLQPFLNQYPRVFINLVKSNIFPDMISETYDVYLRYDEVHTRTLQSVPLIKHNMCLAASKEYLKKKEPLHSLKGLAQHNGIVHQVNAQEGYYWYLSDKGKTIQYPIQAQLLVNNTGLALEACLSHMGIVCLPRYLLAPYLKQGLLEEVLSNYHNKDLTVYLVYPRRQFSSKKIDCFVQHLIKEYKALKKSDLHERY